MILWLVTPICHIYLMFWFTPYSRSFTKSFSQSEQVKWKVSNLKIQTAKSIFFLFFVCSFLASHYGSSSICKPETLRHCPPSSSRELWERILCHHPFLLWLLLFSLFLLFLSILMTLVLFGGMLIVVLKKKWLETNHQQALIYLFFLKKNWPL